MKKQTLRLALVLFLTLPLLSACSIARTAVGTAVDIVTLPVDLLTFQEDQNTRHMDEEK